METLPKTLHNLKYRVNDFPVNTDFISTFKKSSNGISYKMGKLTNET